VKGGSGLILREDQAEWQNAVRSAEIRKGKEERRAAKGAVASWDDPDVSIFVVVFQVIATLRIF